MLIVSPAAVPARSGVEFSGLVDALSALGTLRYGQVCLKLLERYLRVEHWAIYRHRASGTVKCIASGSNSYSVAAEANVEKFVTHHYRVDPTLRAVEKNRSRRDCIVKMDVTEIDDRNYRACFDTVRVRERMSYITSSGRDLIQLCVFRGSRRATFSDEEVADFSVWAQIIASTAHQHESLIDRRVLNIADMDARDMIERLGEFCPTLSDREREVCVRAAAGRTIDETAAELGVARTSVITYRQRAYQKLKISRCGELVPLICGMNEPRSRQLS